MTSFPVPGQVKRTSLPFSRNCSINIIKMGMKFGNLAKFRGVITYTLSPHEQKAFAGAFSRGLPNIFRRFRSKVFIVTPPFVVAYLIYSWGNAENAKSKRKNLADFENES